MRLLHRVIVLLFVSTVAAAAAAPTRADQPLVNQVPADVFVYVGWAGADTLKPAYDASHLAAVYNASNLPQLVEQHLPMMWQQMLQGEKPQQAASARRAAELFWHHPAALYVEAMKAPVAVNSQPTLGLMCDAGPDAGELLQCLRALPPTTFGPRARITQTGTIVRVTTAAGADNVPDKLPAAPPYASSLAHVQPPSLSSSALSLYVNAALIIDQTNQMTAFDPQAAGMWPKIRDSLGIANIQSYAMALGFADKDWMRAAYLAAPAPRAGLLTAIEPHAADPALLARVPATADAVSVASFDAAKLIDVLHDTATSVGHEKEFNQVLGGASMMLGRNLRRQIVGPLGGQWVMYSAAGTGGPVLMNKVSDEKAAQDGLVSAIYGLVNLINGQVGGRGSPPMMTVTQSKGEGGATITTVTLKQYTPSFMIKNGVLYVATSADTVVAAAGAPDVAANADVTQSPAFTAAVQRLGSDVPRPLVDFSYANLPVTAPDAYKTLKDGIQTLHDLVTKNGGDAPDVKLPPFEQITSHLSPAVQVRWADDAGIGARSVSPFPLAATLLGDSQASLTSGGTAALAASILMPAMSRARESANRVKCASNERQIGMGLLMYANDHKGDYPPDLGTLVSSGVLDSVDVFVCPVGTPIPPEIRTAPKAQQATWVNEHSDYVYHGKGSNTKRPNPAETPIISEREGDHKSQGMNVGFADGHVEWVTAARAKQLIQNAPNAGEQGL